VDAQRQPLVRQVANYLAGHPSLRVALSPGLATELAATGGSIPTNVAEPNRADQFIFRLSELSRSAHSAHLASWDATRHDTLDWIGPREVNLNYYPWWGDADHDHAVILNMGAAERMGIVSELSHRTVQEP
jgi:hypothetical protein